MPCRINVAFFGHELAPGRSSALGCAQHCDPIEKFARNIAGAVQLFGRHLIEQVRDRIARHMPVNALDPARIGNTDHCARVYLRAVDVERYGAAGDNGDAQRLRPAFDRDPNRLAERITAAGGGQWQSMFLDAVRMPTNKDGDDGMRISGVK